MKRRVLPLALALMMALVLLPTLALAATFTQVIPYKYDYAGTFSEGLAKVCLDGKWGFIDTTGREVIPLKYNSLRGFHEGLMVIKKGDKCVFIDKTGAEVTSCKYYYEVRNFSEGLAAVQMEKDGKWGFIDKTGAEVVPCKYYAVRDFHEGFAAVVDIKGDEGRWGFIDKTGAEVVPCKYYEVRDFDQGLAVVNAVEFPFHKYGLVDMSGSEVVPCKYAEVGEFSEGLVAIAGNGEGWKFIDKTGAEIIPPKYDGAQGFSEGLAAIKLGGKGWGFIDKTGAEVIPCKYYAVRGFSEDLAAVQMEEYGKWGFIDKTGAEVVPCEYYEVVTDFHQGFAKVKKWEHAEWGLIDKSGSKVVPHIYDDIVGFSEGLAMVSIGDSRLLKWGFIDTTGEEVIPCKYREVGNFSEGLAPVALYSSKDNRLKYGYIAIDDSGSAPQLFTITLILSGGDGPATLTTNADGTLTVPTNPTREGYTFGGWYTDAALTVPWNFNDRAREGLTLYAKWTPVSSTAATVGRSPYAINLNGAAVSGVEGYTLIAPNGGDVTYVKLRDVAALLDGTSAQFNVDWRKGTIYVERDKPYSTRNGTELKPIEGTDDRYRWNTAPILFDGTTTAMEGIVLEGKGGSHTFFKLRDLADAIGFTVDWSAEKGVLISTE